MQLTSFHRMGFGEYMLQPTVVVPLMTIRAGQAVANMSGQSLNQIMKGSRAAHIRKRVQPVRVSADIMTQIPDFMISTAPEATLNGRWKKSHSRSDNMDELYEVAQLPWVLRKGERFLKYLELEHTDGHFRRTFNAGGFLNISEVYPMSGVPQRLTRRDQRRGVMEGRLKKTPAGIVTEVSWGDPHGLDMSDVFELSEDGQSLTVHTTAKRKDGSGEVTVKNVFTRFQ
ncbi:hypothetical protein BSKO_01579 [Bryopsis sp. KO-2023]|nr:hypothetical protein BSKO_01579 [Bryopsis sp. KO-2023]